MRLILITTLLLVACGCGKHHDAKNHQSNNRTAELRALYDTNLVRLGALLEPDTGWPSNHDCDGLLWAGQAYAATSLVKITLAEYSPGVWHRRPAPACWLPDGAPKHESGSTVSNDMFQGLFLGAWVRKDLGILQRLAEYGEANKWVMGQPYPEAADRVVMRPNQVGVLGQLLYAVSNGKIDKPYREWPGLYAPVEADYAEHLQGLEISLRGEVDEYLTEHSLDAVPANKPQPTTLLGINDQQLARLQALVKSKPLNPLFAAALGTYDGNMARAVTLLLDPATPAPSYARGDRPEVFELVAWLSAARLALSRIE